MGELVGPDVVHQGVALECSPLSTRRIPRESRLLATRVPSASGHSADAPGSWTWQVQRRHRLAPEQQAPPPLSSTAWEPWQQTWQAQTAPLVLALEHVSYLRIACAPPLAAGSSAPQDNSIFGVFTG